VGNRGRFIGRKTCGKSIDGSVWREISILFVYFYLNCLLAKQLNWGVRFASSGWRPATAWGAVVTWRLLEAGSVSLQVGYRFRGARRSVGRAVGTLTWGRIVFTRSGCERRSLGFPLQHVFLLFLNGGGL
jgi:hypothetical protein